MDVNKFIGSQNHPTKALPRSQPRLPHIDPAVARAGRRESILSYTMVPMELYATLQAMYDPESVHEATMAEPTRLSGRVLLAEDNIVNQQVTRAMLESLGLEVHFFLMDDKSFRDREHHAHSISQQIH